VFNPNVAPKDDRGELICEGTYQVKKPGYQYILVATVYADDALTLWVKFEGHERPQRVDELSQFCEWVRVKEPVG
jgi:hypothetical protein